MNRIDVQSTIQRRREEADAIQKKVAAQQETLQTLQVGLFGVETSLTTLSSQTDSIRLRVAVLRANLQWRTEMKAVTAIMVEEKRRNDSQEKLTALRNQQIAVDIDTLQKEQRLLESSIVQNSAKW